VFTSPLTRPNLKRPIINHAENRNMLVYIMAIHVSNKGVYRAMLPISLVQYVMCQQK